MNDPVHRPVKLFPRFDPAVVEPAVARVLSLAVGRIRAPRDVPPKDWFVKAGALENCPGVDSVIEKYDQGRSPVVTHAERLLPAAGPLQSVGGEVQSIQIGLGQVMASGNIPLRFGAWEPGQLGDVILLPGPGHNRSEILAGLVRRTPRIRAAILGCFLVDPVQKIANMRTIDLGNIDAIAPGNPLGDSRFVLFAGSA